MQEILAERRRVLEEQIQWSRSILQKELLEALNEVRKGIPEQVLKMKLADFLLMSQIPPVEQVLQAKLSVDKERRVTRSMSMAKRETIISQNIGTERDSILQTPKFNPGLPETPAAIRQMNKKRKNAVDGDDLRSSSVFTDAISTDFRQLRVTRSTINNTIGKKKESLSGGIVSLEMADGKVLDIDITQSPSKISSQLGNDAVRDMKNKMQAYAAQLKSFFKRLKVSDN